MRKGILVASFGTTYQDTREKNIDAIVKCVKEKYKDTAVYEAYTSGKIRKALETADIKKYTILSQHNMSLLSDHYPVFIDAVI